MKIYDKLGEIILLLKPCSILKLILNLEVVRQKQEFWNNNCPEN